MNTRLIVNRRLLQAATLILIVLMSACTTILAETKIAMLGTGTPVHDPERSGPAVAIVTNGTAYLFDFGPGVVRRAAAFAPRFGGSIEALDAGNLNIAFLTHLHSDHTAGFGDLLMTGWSSGKRSEIMQVYGPDGIQQLVAGTLEAFEDDIKYRLYARGRASDLGWRVKAESVKEGLVYQDYAVKVIAFPVIHGTWPNAFGYRIETQDKVIVYSGDLKPSDKIQEYSNNADYLIHEVYCEAGFKKRSQEDQEYHASNHTSTVELAALANIVKPKKLVLNHVLFFGCSGEEIVNEVKADYNGEVILANDLDLYE